MNETLRGACCRALNIGNAVLNFVGDRRVKNGLLMLLFLMNAFGMIAPDRATSLRDLVLSLVF